MRLGRTPAKAMAAIGLLFAVLFAARPVHAETLLRVRLNADIVSTMPGMRRDENTDAVLLHIVEGLVASREDGSDRCWRKAGPCRQTAGSIPSRCAMASAFTMVQS
jgi:hypothetical protein